MIQRQRDKTSTIGTSDIGRNGSLRMERNYIILKNTNVKIKRIQNEDFKKYFTVAGSLNFKIKKSENSREPTVN